MTPDLAALEQTPRLVAVADLRPHPDNPRTITAEALDRLKRTLERHPGLLWARPLIALPDGTVIAGNQRLTAAVMLGWEQVPVVTEDLDEQTAREWALVDNNGFGDWDDTGLAQWIDTLQDMGSPLELLGFPDDDLARLLALANPEVLEPGEDPGPGSVPVSPITVLGDVIQLGDHVLVCGDCTNPDVLDQAVAGGVADLVVTDPPYGVDYTGGQRADQDEREPLAGDKTPGLYSQFIPLLAGATSPQAAMYLWHAGALSGPVANALDAAGWEIRAQIIWHKLNATYGAFMAQYMPKHEPVFYAHRRGESPAWHGPTNEVTVWEAPQARVNDLHPTQKPPELAERAIANSSRPGDLVLDPFAGSGSTLVACERTGRRAALVELDPGYCDVIVTRWEQMTGQEATR